jgi:hypothetical protein
MLFATAFLVLVFSSNLIAQKDFIIIKSKEKVVLNQEHKQKFENLLMDSTYKSLTFIEIGNLKSFVNSGVLTFKLPGRHGNIVAKVKDFEFNSESDFVWKGDLVNSEGNISLFCEDGNIFGSINVDNNIYEIQDFDGTLLLVEYNNEYLSKRKVTVIKNDTNSKDKSINQDDIVLLNESLVCTGQVRVLVAYTPAAQSRVPNILNTAYLAVNQFNEVLANSSISYNQLRINLASTLLVDLVESDDPFYDINRLRLSPEFLYLREYRDQKQADIVVLLTKGYQDGIWSISSAAYVGPSQNYPYAIACVSSVTSDYSFITAVGHLFGCNNNRPQNAVGYAYPHKFITGYLWWKEYFTSVMHNPYQDENYNWYNRIPYFSNPNVSYKGKPTGTSGANNARTLIENSCIVENFKPYTPPPSVQITGPSKGDNTQTYTWSATAIGGQPPYTYSWSYSLDGFNYNSGFGIGEIVTAPLPFNSDLYLKVTITDSNNNQAVDFHYTMNMDAGIYPELQLKSLTDEGILHDSISNTNSILFAPTTSATIFPNPADKDITIDFNLEKETSVKIFIVNSFGNSEKIFELGYLVPGKYSRNLKINSLKNGVYYVNIVTEFTSESVKLTIHK